MRPIQGHGITTRLSIWTARTIQAKRRDGGHGRKKNGLPSLFRALFLKSYLRQRNVNERGMHGLVAGIVNMTTFLRMGRCAVVDVVERCKGFVFRTVTDSPIVVQNPGGNRISRVAG